MNSLQAISLFSSLRVPIERLQHRPIVYDKKKKIKLDITHLMTDEMITYLYSKVTVTLTQQWNNDFVQ